MNNKIKINEFIRTILKTNKNINSIRKLALNSFIARSTFKNWFNFSRSPNLTTLLQTFNTLNVNLDNYFLSDLFSQEESNDFIESRIGKLSVKNSTRIYSFIKLRLKELDEIDPLPKKRSISWLAVEAKINENTIYTWKFNSPRFDSVCFVLNSLKLDFKTIPLSYIFDDNVSRIKHFRSNVLILFVLSILFSLFFGSALSYFLSNQKTTNKFTVGEVKIDVTEHKWDDLEDTNENNIPDETENFVPNQVIDKDPTITNIGNNDAYVYFEVVVPTADGIIVADDDGNRLPVADDVELWTFSVNEGWTQLSKTVNKDNTVTYVYCANDALSSGSSVTLFETVSMANVIEGQGLEDTEQVITAKGMAIQTELVDDPIDGFEKYLKQKGE